MSVPELTPLEQQIIDNVRQHGCMIMHVFDPAGEEPNFSYSIGFPETVSQPEVIVFGLDKKLMHSMINETWRQCSEDGLDLADGICISDLIEGFDCVAREITSPNAIREHFGSAIWYNRTRRNEKLTRAFQLVWPGAQQGLYPWDRECSTEVTDWQPPLYEVAA